MLANNRRRVNIARDKVLLKWFYNVKRSVKALTGGKTATVVWGVKVAPTGIGNIPAPTCRVYDVAKRIEDWKIVSGDEFRTSKYSCIAPHTINYSPRFVGKPEIKTVKRPETFENKIRKTIMIGLNAKRLLRRYNQDKTKNFRERNSDSLSKEKTSWIYDGHSGESPEDKAAAKTKRFEKSMKAKYVRGLRVCQNEGITKILDRDINGSINIGKIWISDNVAFHTRPEIFIRPIYTRNLK